MGFDRAGISPRPTKVVRKKAPPKKVVRKAAVVRPDVVVGYARPVHRTPSFEESLASVARTVRGAKVVRVAPTRKERDYAAFDRAAAQQQSVTSPAVKVLNQTLRPVRASAGAVDAIVQGHAGQAPKAIKRGLVANKGPLYSKVLKDVGAPKVLRAPVGFVLDVATDPTTYLSFGASVPLRAAARAAAIKVTGEQLAKGASKAAADRAGRAAAKAVIVDPKLANKGLTIGVRAKVPLAKRPLIDVKTSGKTTAAISRRTGLSKVATKVRESGPVQRVAVEAVHDFRPAGVTPAAHAKVRAAQRELRAQTAKARRETDRQARALRQAIPDQATAQRLIDHIESGRPLHELGDLAPVARDVRRLTGETFDIKKAHGLLNLPYRPGRVMAVPPPPVVPSVREAKVARVRTGRALQAAERKAAKEHGRTQLLVEQQHGRDQTRAAQLDLQATGLEDQAARLLQASRKNTMGQRATDPLKNVGLETKAQRSYRLKSNRLGVRKQGVQVGSQAYRTGQRQARRAVEVKQRAEALRAEAEGARSATVGEVARPVKALSRLERAQGDVLAARQAHEAATARVKVVKAQARAAQAPRAPELTIDPKLALTDAQRYLPRVRRMDLEPGRKGIVRRKVGVAKVAPELHREFREPLSVIRETHPHVFSEDLPASLAHASLQAKEKAAVADFWQKVAKASRPLNAQTAKDIDLSHEMVFQVTPHGLEPLVKEGGDKLDLPRLQRALDGEGRQHAILDRAQYERIARGMTDNRTDAGKAFDKVQGRWKTLVTVPMPSYHVRNLVGDSMNAFLADATAHAFSQASKVLASRVTRNRAERGALRPEDTSPSITIAGRQMTHRELLDEAERHGVIDQGFIARELPHEAQRKAGPISRAAQYREDVPRLATYISARERGLTPSEAADWANVHHFDYGDLTATERATRRAIPFYTFFARNTRLQATKVITRPGKQATLAKALNESAQAAGFNSYDAYAQALPDYQQRGLPISIKTGKGITSWVYNPPTTDLNALSTHPGDFAQNIAQRLTAAKLVGELYANYSIFFQGPIEQSGRKLVPAPAVLGELPAPVRKKLGIERYRDKRRGLIWGWPAKTDYTARQLPETNLLVQQLTPVPGSREQTRGQALVGALTGAKPTTYAKTVQDEEIRRESDKLHKLTTRRDNLLRTPQAAGPDGYASPKLVALREQIKAQDAKVTALRTRRGDDTATHQLDASPEVLLQQRFNEFTRNPNATADALQRRFEAFQKGGG